MRRVLGCLLLWLGIAPGAAMAHDIGVSQAELTEQSGNRYRLSVQAGPAVRHLFAAPELPAHCRSPGNPGGLQGAGGISFEFECDQSLTASDRIGLAWRRDGIVLTARWLNGNRAQRLFLNESGRIDVGLGELQAGSGSWIGAAGRYTGLGVEHILLGIDHLLFVLCLLLIVDGLSMLVKTITAFTVSHSITLGLATLGVVDLPPRPVEAAIALSIVFLALEILRARQGETGLSWRRPWVVAFGFGLLHGLGFAGALSGLGLPRSEIPVALLFFNIGVELGQLLFVAATLSIRWSLVRLLPGWPQRVRLSAVYVAGTLATYWFIQRVGSMVVAG